MEKIKAGAIVVFVIGLLGIILSAAWDLIASKSECCIGNYQTAGIVGGVIVAVVGAVLLVYKPKIKEEKEEEKKEEKLKEKKEKK